LYKARDNYGANNKDEKKDGNLHEKKSPYFIEINKEGELLWKF
jgi:hypothetical protein